MFKIKFIFAIWTVVCLFHSVASQVFKGKPVNQQNRPKYLVFITVENLNDEYIIDRICGGIILNKWWVLTAAHCLESLVDYQSSKSPRRYDLVSPLNIVAGDINYKVAGAKTRLKISSHFWVLHHGYYHGTNAHDVALIKTDDKIQFNDNVLPALIPNANQPLEKLVNCTVYGWGPSTEEEEKSGSHTLREGKFQYVGERENFYYFNTKNMQAATSGDSGGPVACLNENSNKPLVYGVVQSGDGDWQRMCTAKTCYQSVTKILPYIDWMERVISSRTPTQPIQQESVHRDPGFVALLFVNYEGKGKNYDKKCHGAFIARKWLIAAAHCFDDDPDESEVKSVVAEFGLVSRTATDWFIHKHYGDEAEQYRDYDVGLVYFADNFGPRNPAHLPPREGLNYKEVQLRLTYFVVDIDYHKINHQYFDELKSVDAKFKLTPRLNGLSEDLHGHLISVKVEKGFTPVAGILHTDDGAVVGVKIRGQNFGGGKKHFTKIADYVHWIKSCMTTVSNVINSAKFSTRSSPPQFGYNRRCEKVKIKHSSLNKIET